MKIYQVKKYAVILGIMLLAGTANAETQTSKHLNTQTLKHSNTSSRIVVGREAEPGAWPWMAALIYSDASSLYYGQFCGGSLIHPSWVVTAAHCVEDAEPEDVDVALGVYDLEHDIGERVGVKRIIMHPDFDYWMLDSDIALLELAHPVNYETISPVSNSDDLLEGKESATVGWGATDPDFLEYPDTLQQMSLPISSNEACQNLFDDMSITENMICSGYGGDVRACWGDSGGPVMIRDQNDIWKLAGIVSWGHCWESGYSSVSARVSQFIGFINQYVPISLSGSSGLVVSVPESVTEGDGKITGGGTVKLKDAAEDDLLISLKSDSPSDLIVPNSIIIPAGQISATFDITVLDDTLLDGAQTVRITASAPGFSSVTRVIRISDNETATLYLTLPPKAAEDAGLLQNHGVIRVSRTVDKDISVSLISSDTSELTVPSTVTIPEGTSEARFDIKVVNDGAEDGTQIVTVIGAVPGWISNSANMEVVHCEQPDYFTDRISRGNYLDYQHLTFTPDGSASFYSLCREDADGFPVDPSGGTWLSLSDDAYKQATLSDGEQVFLYGIGYSSFYIGSNGYLTFDSGDMTSESALPEHFSQPRISALFNDLNPEGAKRIRWKQMDDRAVVTYQGVPGYSGGSNNFQIEMFFNGVIRLTYLDISASSGIAGLSKGNGTPAHFVESRLNAYPSCDSFLSVELPETVTEGESKQGIVRVPRAPNTDLRVSLTSEDTSELTVPVIAIIPADETSGTFTLRGADDAILDGPQKAVVIAYADGYESRGDVIQVLDKDTAVVTVTVPEHATEGDGVLAGGGKVTLSRPADAYITLSLTSDNPRQIAVPETVVIPAECTSATYDITVLYDGESDETETVTITASVPGWNSGSDTIEVASAEFDYFTERFNGDNDLSYQTLTFTPDGSANFYQACRSYAKQFPVSSAEGITLSLSDDDYEKVVLSDRAQVFLYGVPYTSFYTGSNGYITFESGDSDHSESLSDHFERPRVSALFDDLYSGNISWQQLDDRAVVTYQDMKCRGGFGSNSFQIELFFNGVIRITYLNITSKEGIAGLSEGNGIPENFVESDLTAYTPCGPSLTVEILETATEGDGTFTGTVSVKNAPEEDLLIHLISTNASEVAVSPTVTIQAGQTRAPFSLTVMDDTLLDGTQRVSVTASAAGYSFGTDMIQVKDNETAQLMVTVPERATEGDGVLSGKGTVRISKPASRDFVVSLTSNDTSEITVPDIVILPAGEDHIDFDITVVYDGETDGDQSAVIQASVEGWNSGSARIEVADYHLDFFTEEFEEANDLSFQSISFIPDGSKNFYGVCRKDIEAFPTDPEGGTPVSFLSYDSYQEVELSEGKKVLLYGTAYSSFYVGENGSVTFGSEGGYRSLSDHFSYPRISGLFTRLYLKEDQITWKQLSNRAVVTYNDYFQIEMFFSGVIRITYLDIDWKWGIAGLSEGKGMPDGFAESDLSAYDACPPSLILNVPEAVIEGDYKEGTMSIAEATDTNLLIYLTSSDPSEVVVPEIFTIPAGQTSAVFDIVVPDDRLLDGTQVAAIYASDSAYRFDSKDIRVRDNETAILTVNIPNRAAEGDKILSGKGAVMVSEPVDSDVTVSLTSDDISEITVPETVIIPAGQESAEFDLTVVYDGESDGTQTVKITASLEGWTPGSDTIEVEDRTIDYFTEQFEDNNDLAYQTFTFTPDGSEVFYKLCREKAETFPTDPEGGTLLSLTDDDYEEVSLADGAQISLYGVGYTSFYVGSNGYITFDAGDEDYSESLSDHFDQPRISALFDDLNGEEITWTQLEDRAVVTYQEVDGNNFQIEMFFSGVIRITYLNIDAYHAVVGLSEGYEIPSDFIESDLSNYPFCIPYVYVEVPETVAEGDGILTGQVRLDNAVDYSLKITLTPDNPAEIAVPETVIIPAGEISADFNISILDDIVLDGAKSVTVSASASGYLSDEKIIIVKDNESATLTVSLPESATEGDGVLSGQGAVHIDMIAAADFTVYLASDDTSEITVPESVIIPAGKDTASFDLTVIYDIFDDGTRAATVTASAEGWTSGSNIIQVLNYKLDFFTEVFDEGTDIAYQTFTFTPDGSRNFYSVCRKAATAFPTDPAAGDSISLSILSFEQVNLSGGAQVYLYGTAYSSFYVCSNGSVTFGSPGDKFSESLSEYFAFPRIAGLFEDLDPGTIIWKQRNDRVAITYQDFRQSYEESNDFQIEIFFNGVIRITYLDMPARYAGVAGLSEGKGTPHDFTNSDLSNYPICEPSNTLFVDIPEVVTEGVNVLANQGRVRLQNPAENHLVVNLVSDDTSDVIVPAAVLILTGQTSATFDLTILDDEVYDRIEPVIITASAEDCKSGSAKMWVLDKNAVGIPADVDFSGIVDLGDAVLALKVMAGASGGYYVYPGADITGDGKIGLEDVIFILQWVIEN
jgi:secreted trypsin-like serine protease